MTHSLVVSLELNFALSGILDLFQIAEVGGDPLAYWLLSEKEVAKRF